MPLTFQGESPPEYLNEKILQSALYDDLGRPKNSIINASGVYRWESDMLVVRRGEVGEYEIKLSHQDFLADQKKNRCHILSNYETYRRIVPNYFYYVCLEGLISREEIPRYAGLIWMRWLSGPVYRKGYPTKDTEWWLKASYEVQAPVLHHLKIKPGQAQGIMYRAVYRMWDLTGRLGKAQAEVKSLRKKLETEKRDE